MKRRGSTKGLDSSSPPSSPTMPSSSSPPSTPHNTSNHKDNNHKKHSSFNKPLKDHYIFHETSRASLLSTEAPAQNYRGLINLVMLVLVCVFIYYARYTMIIICNVMVISLQFVTHIRLIMENILKYGILVNLTSTYVNWFATIPTLFSMHSIRFIHFLHLLSVECMILTYTLGYNFFILAAFAIERRVQSKKITEKRCTIEHVINCVAVLAAPITLIEVTDALPGIYCFLSLSIIHYSIISLRS